MRIMREGGSIGMAPEGNRTYSGTTEHMKSGVAAMAKALKMPLAFFRIEGGYGTHPRWSDDIRKGRMRGYFSRIIPYEEVRAMSDEELFELIKRELYVDEREDETLFKSKRPAEFLDRAMYYCPQCKLSTFYAEGDTIACTKCGRAVRYLENKRLLGVGFDFEFDNVKDWYDAQSDYIRNLDLSPYEDVPVYEEEVAFSENIYCKRKILIDKHAKIRIFSDRLAVSTQKEEFVFPFKDIVAATVLGKNKLNFYVGSKIYQFKGDKHFNALKYLNLYYHATETRVKENEPQFLGL
jgi:1-acyl-sn-glycerol-3-phosphate acyltransferase